MREDHHDLVGTSAQERADARGEELTRKLDVQRLAEAVMKLPLTVEQRKAAGADLIRNFGEAHRPAVEEALGLQSARKPEEPVSPQRPAHASRQGSASVLGAPPSRAPALSAQQLLDEVVILGPPKVPVSIGWPTPPFAHTKPAQEPHNLDHVDEVARADVEGVKKAFQSYGDSWKKRGGAGAFIVTARKWDRLENCLTQHHYDVFQAAERDTRAEGIIDDIRDLRRYLLLWEAELIARGVRHGASRDNK